MDVLFGIPLPNCPYEKSIYLVHNPVISGTFALLSLLLLFFGINSCWRNGLVVFNRRISHPSIKNTWFIMFFLVSSLSFIVETVRYAINLPRSFEISRWSEELVDPFVIDAWLLLCASFFRNVSWLFLAFGLRHQLIHRSHCICV